MDLNLNRALCSKGSILSDRVSRVNETGVVHKRLTIYRVPSERAPSGKAGLHGRRISRALDGPGDIRYCEFTTGSFVEPITAWEEPYRLAFDVTDQPEPMFGLSLYNQVHPPHLSGYLRSTHGELLLIALPRDQTRLEGRTWDRFQMHPQRYWTAWSDVLIHRIHERVLDHIRQLAETELAYTAATSPSSAGTNGNSTSGR
jgi:hypothetical protein